MKRLWLKMMCLISGFYIFCSNIALAAAPAKGGTKLVVVADTRKLSGFGKFMANTYNENLLLFAIYVLVIMAVIGLTLGFLMDKIMAMTGIELGKYEKHE